MNMFLYLRSRVAENSTFLLLGDRHPHPRSRGSRVRYRLDDVSSIPRLKGKAAEAFTHASPQKIKGGFLDL